MNNTDIRRADTRATKKANGWGRDFKRNWRLYAMLFLPVAFVFVFAYWPMYGAQIAFRDFEPGKGIWGSDWVNFLHFQKFFKVPMFRRLIENTLRISIYGLIAGFPVPILLALGLNMCVFPKLKRTVQMVTYAPYFISTVVLVGLILQFFDPKVGIVNQAISALGFPTVSFMSNAGLFDDMYVWTGVWQGAGWGSIIYLAALSSIDPQLHEAAIVDGASRLRRVWHIDLPGILPTMTILLILSAGNIMGVGFEKIYLMQNPLNLQKSEVISTYVYTIGLTGMPRYSYATAVGLFNSVINFALIIIVNQIAKRVSDTSLW